MSRTGGFTLVEMLVVIGIIVLLIGILAPALNIAYTHSIRNRMQLDIQSISAALEAYKNDMRSYPTLDYNDTSGVMTAAYPASVLLCNALIAPRAAAADGVDGPGFSVVPGGQVYGPYIEPSRFKLVADPNLTSQFFLADRYNHPILYFKSNTGANVQATKGYVAAWTPTASTVQPRFNFSDDCGSSTNPALVWAGETTTTNGLQRMSLMLGDFNNNGAIDPVGTSGFGSEIPVNLPYLLWGAGPDEVFGIDVSKGTASVNLQVESTYVPSNDDATNFLNLK